VCQEAVSRAWQESESWSRKAVLNVAAMGPFSSDRSIGEYSERIWKVPPVRVTL
jgi:starch phosphorylase